MREAGRLVALLRIAVICLGVGMTSAVAQSDTQVQPAVRGEILTIESDRLFADSAFGQRVLRDIEAQQSILLAENRKIETELAAEEKRLTELRKEMTPEDFRAVADAFASRVEEVRQEQDAKARSIGEMRERQQALFIQAADPILLALMREAGATVILERRAVFFSAESVDITNLAIERLNRTIGDGAVKANDQ